MVNFPTSLDTKGTTLFDIKSRAESTLTSSITSSQNTIPVADLTQFQSVGGIAWIENEKILYTARSASSGAGNLTGVTRGYDSTTAASHASGVIVEQLVDNLHLNNLVDAVLELEEYVFGEVIDVEAYGAVGDGVFNGNGAMTNASATLTVTGGSFASADVGKRIMVYNAGAAGATLSTTISAVTNANTVTLATAAGATVSGTTVYYGTNDLSAFNSAMAALPTFGGRIRIKGSGIYILHGKWAGSLGKPIWIEGQVMPDNDVINGTMLVFTHTDSTNCIEFDASATHLKALPRIRNIGIVGNENTGSGIVVKDGLDGYAIFEEVAVFYCGVDGFRIDGGGSGETTSNNTFINCVARLNVGVGINLIGATSSTYFYGCKSIQNQGGNLKHFSLNSNLAGEIGVFGGDFSQYTYDARSISLEHVGGVTIDNVYTETTSSLATRAQHFVFISGTGSGEQRNTNVKITNSQIACGDQTAGGGYPLYVQNATRVVIENNRFAPGVTAITDGAMTNGSANLTSSTAMFTDADVGLAVVVTGAGASGGNLTTTVSSVTSATVAVLANAASTTVNPATFTISRPAFFDSTSSNVDWRNNLVTTGARPIINATNYWFQDENGKLAYNTTRGAAHIHLKEPAANTVVNTIYESGTRLWNVGVRNTSGGPYEIIDGTQGLRRFSIDDNGIVDTVTGGLREAGRPVVSKHTLSVTGVGTGEATAETDLQSATVAASLISTTGAIRVRATGTVTGTNDAKTIKLYFGATAIATISLVAGDTGDWVIEALIANDGATNAQKVMVTGKLGTSDKVSDIYTTATIDTTATVTVKTTGTTTNASDEVTSEILFIETIR